jgi:penicillin-binding protein 2
LCSGYFKFENDDRVFHCWGTHYWTSIFKAIAISCNVYFFNTGYELGSEKIAKYARSYGFGAKSGVDLPGEMEGFIPSAKWKKARFNESWYDGDTINMAIGQGFTLVTPIQITDVMCGIVNGGVIYKPHILKEVYSSETKKLKKIIKPEIIYNAPIRETTLNIIKQGLRGVMTYGTAKVANSVCRVQAAGKTGTAQFTKNDPHSWFVGYAPYGDSASLKDEDKIVVTVLFEHAGGGGEVAAPVAMAIMESYFYKTDIKDTKRRIVGKVKEDSYRRFLLRKQKKETEEQIETDDIQF